MVTAFEPTKRDTDADQLAVPEAVPDCPVLVAQATEATPTLSLDVPEKVIEDAEVDIVLDDGDKIVNVGGVVSVGVFTGGVLPVGGGWRATETS